MRRIWKAVCLLIGAAALVLLPGSALAGGGGFGGGPCAGFAAGGTMTMLDSCFDGIAHFTDSGTTLIVRNEGSLPHSFTAVDGSFDSGLLDAGETAEIPLDSSGIVRVYCTLHGTAQGKGMTGVLVVGEPTPQGVGAGTGVVELQEALHEHDEALLVEIEAVRQALESAVAKPQMAESAASDAGNATPLALAQLLGVLGVVLGGAALAMVLKR